MVNRYCIYLFNIFMYLLSRPKIRRGGEGGGGGGGVQ
jgi:hypothetical protein